MRDRSEARGQRRMDSGDGGTARGGVGDEGNGGKTNPAGRPSRGAGGIENQNDSARRRRQAVSAQRGEHRAGQAGMMEIRVPGGKGAGVVTTGMMMPGVRVGED